MVFGDVFDVVRLVDNHITIFRKNRNVLLAQYKVAEQQRVIGDDNLCGFKPAAISPVKAFIEMRTISAFAVAVFAHNRLPNLRRWRKTNIAQRAVFRLFRPVAQSNKRCHIAVKKPLSSAGREF